MRGVQGDTNNNVYRVGRKDEKGEHRRLAGVTTDTGRPCSTGPFGQKFWDRYAFSDSTDATAQDKTLDTDEWPMASFLYEDPHPTSLRCITATDNQNAGRAWQKFLYQDPKGLRLEAGTRFKVNFDFAAFVTGRSRDDKIFKYALQPHNVLIS